MKNLICHSKMTFEECELAILRSAVDEVEKIKGKSVASSPYIKKMVNIVENFLKYKNLVCYGGTAINNILPKQDQFYNKEVEIPDYDFFSPNALEDAKALADLYVKYGFIEVEAKAGQHVGTFKVFVNFTPVADVTHLPPELYDTIKKSSIRVAGILYAPPNYLRMGMYLELSRPAGDVGRWEKVLKRLTLLNKHYPLKAKECSKVDFQRKMENPENVSAVYDTVLNTFIDQGVVFFGGYALSLYSQYMPKTLQKKLKKIPDFDVLSDEPEITSEIVKERLHDAGIDNVEIVKQAGVGEVISAHYEVRVGNDTIAFIYEPLACHSYNIIVHNERDIKIATIDTMLSFYLAFMYVDRPYYDPARIICMSNYLFEVQEKNRLEQKGLLKRFSLNCIGHQETVEEMRAEKAKKFRELKEKTGKESKKEYEFWFLRYRPADVKQEQKPFKKTRKHRPRIKKTRKNKRMFKLF